MKKKSQTFYFTKRQITGKHGNLIAK